MNMTAKTQRPGSSRSFGRADEWALVSVLAGLVASVCLGAMSDGFYHDDDITHFLIARQSWRDATAMLMQWARPGYNIPAAAAAAVGGMWACRLLSALMTAATAWLAWRICRRHGLDGRGPAVAAPALVWLQPTAMTLSLTTLTETPAMLYLALAVWLMLKARPILASACMSLLVVTRYELLPLAGLLGLWVWFDLAGHEVKRLPAALLRPKLWMAVGALLWAPAAYVLASAGADLPADLSVLHIFDRGYSDVHGAGAWYHFLVCWTMAAGAGVLALAVTGMLVAGRRLGWLSLMILAVVAIQSAIFVRGLFASGGYPRFLVPIAPLTAVAACFGMEALRDPRRRWVALLPPITVALAAVGPGLVLRDERLLAGGWIATAVLLSIAAFLAGLIVSERGRWCGRVSLILAWLLVAGQFVALMRPLRLPSASDRSAQLGWWSEPMVFAGNQERRPVMQCLYETPQLWDPDQGVLALHPLIRFCRGGDLPTVFGLDEAMQRWREAEPGTLFVWDNRYGQWTGFPRSEPTEQGQALRRSLRRLGRTVAAYDNGWARVELYRRERIASQQP